MRTDEESNLKHPRCVFIDEYWEYYGQIVLETIWVFKGEYAQQED